MKYAKSSLPDEYVPAPCDMNKLYALKLREGPAMIAEAKQQEAEKRANTAQQKAVMAKQGSGRIRSRWGIRIDQGRIKRELYT